MKMLTAFMAVLIGIVLMSRLYEPIEYALANINGIGNINGDLFTLMNFGLGMLGIFCFYRGLFRFFEFRGFKVKVSDDTVTVKRSDEIKLRQFEIINPTDFSCDLKGGEVVVSCLDQNNSRSQILREDNSISDCLSILQELTGEIEKKIKR